MTHNNLSPAMQTALEQYKTAGTLAGVHKRTREALVRRGLVSESTPIAEMIGSEQSYRYRWFNDEFRLAPTVDARRGDYAFWDRARKGQARGLELAGVFLKPLESKISAWVLGAMPKFKSENPEMVALMTEWWRDNRAAILKAYRESIGLGDFYIVFNGDGTLTVVAPHVVEPIKSDSDFSQLVGYRITQVYSHPAHMAVTQTIVDEYTTEKRVRKFYKGGTLLRTETYRNPLKLIPVIHVGNQMTAGELYGRPEGEALLSILRLYNDVMMAGGQGNIRQGRPTPTIEEVPPTALKQIYDMYAEDEEYFDKAGNRKTRKVLRYSSDNMMLTAGKFKYAQPGSFASDTEKLLGLLFYLILQHTEIPEFIWGNAIASSKASADSQLAPFAKFVEARQLSIETWLLPLLALAAAWLKLTNPVLRKEDSVSVVHPPLTDKDDKLTLDAIALGRREQLLDRETALQHMPLDIDDPQAVLDAVDAEIEAGEAKLAALRQAQVERDTGFEDDAEDDSDDSDLAQEMREITEAAKGHTGVMVAFMVGDDVVRELVTAAANAGVRGLVDGHHVTLAYLGEMDALADVRERIEAAVTAFAGIHPPLDARVSGVGRFTATHRAGQDALYASVDSPELPNFRANLIRELSAQGVVFQSEHGFTPHITLAYLDEKMPMPDLRLPPRALHFTEVVLAWGDLHIRYPLMSV